MLQQHHTPTAFHATRQTNACGRQSGVESCEKRKSLKSLLIFAQAGRRTQISKQPESTPQLLKNEVTESYINMHILVHIRL